MSLAVHLRTGAGLGAVAGAALGGISYSANSNRNNLIKMSTIGAVYGVALAALGHYAGQASVVGALVGLVVCSKVTLLALTDEGQLYALFVSTMAATLGSVAGYAFGLLQIQ